MGSGNVELLYVDPGNGSGRKVEDGRSAKDGASNKFKCRIVGDEKDLASSASAARNILRSAKIGG